MRVLEMSAQMLNELNERLAKLPYLGGYEVSNEDKGTFKIKNLCIRGFTHTNYIIFKVLKIFEPVRLPW